MKFDLFINLDGNCREALEFYANVFKSEAKNLTTYGESPADPNYPLNEGDKDKIMYAEIPVGDMLVMFMDMPAGYPLVTGNNINPSIKVDSPAEAERLYNQLKEDGKVHMDLQKTFFSELYCMVEDKYGLIWHVLYNAQ